MSRRLRPVERRASLLFLVAAVVGAPTFGWLAALPFLPGLALFWFLQNRLERYRRPELVLLSCLALLEVGIAASTAMAQGPRVYLLPVFILPALLASVAFPTRVAAVMAIFTGQLMLIVALGFDLEAVRSMPFALLYPLVVVIAGSGVAMVVARLDQATRGSALMDLLTGMPNRAALSARVAELEHQSQISRRPVALVVGDPDGFKAINDRHGHAVGDRVLREVAARIDATLGPQSAAFRLGGEEFVVLVSDTGIAGGVEVADRLCRAVSAEPIEGLDVRMSVGVSASAPGQAFSFDRVFGLADSALYNAKRRGGGRVGVREPTQTTPTGAPAHAVDDAGESATADALAASSNGRASTAPSETDLGTEAIEVASAGDGHGQQGSRWERWSAKEHAATGNWLVRDDLQRTQLLELNRLLRDRAKPGFAISFAVGGLAAVQYGWQIVLPPLLMAAVYILTEHRLSRFAHPEFALGLCWIGLQISLMMSGLLADQQMLFAWPLLLMLIFGNAAVFPPRGVALGIVLTVAIMFVVAFVEDPELVTSSPGTLALALATVVSVGMLGAAVGRSTIAYRDLAIVDPLTRLLNRTALASRVTELAHKVATVGAPVAVVVVDIDRFKAINDTFGHSTGDVVLREVGERLRRSLRAFESAYRIGGEEFVIVLDDVDPRRAEKVAVRMRTAISSAPIGPVRVTASLGFATTAPGEAFDYETVFERADAALYEAKQAGGDRVRRAPRPRRAPSERAGRTVTPVLARALDGPSRLGADALVRRLSA